jgi:hypothetical protein
MAIALAIAAAPHAWGAASNISYSFPQNFASSSRFGDGAVSATAWNINGTRCIYSSTKGITNLGFNVAATSATIAGAATPVLTVFSDGTPRAQVASKDSADVAGFTLWTASLTTKCVGGSHPGTLCSANSACGSGGVCVACDHNNNCSTVNVANAPCAGSCSGGSNPGAICTSGADCLGGGTCTAPSLPSGVSTCFTMQKCCTSGSGCTPCDSNGVKSTGTGNGPFHTTLARVTAGGGFLGSNEKIFEYVNGGASDPFNNCSNNCDGGLDRANGTDNAVVCEH